MMKLQQGAFGAVLAAVLGLSAGQASATGLEYTLYVVDGQGNKVSGLKTQVTSYGITVPLVGEIDINGITMRVNDDSVQLSGPLKTCIGKDGCGSQYADKLYSFNSLYGVPIGYGYGEIDATFTNELANSTADARLFGAQDRAGKIVIDDIDPILPEDYAELSVSIKESPAAGYAWGIFADEHYGSEYIKIDAWLVLDRFLATNKFYTETRSGSGQFDFHVVGCLVGGSAGGVCGGGGGGHNPPPDSEVPEPMSLSLLLAGLATGARLRSRAKE